MAKNYMTKSDEELITLIKEGDEDVTDFLMDKYKSLVRNKARTMFILGGETEDLVQEGMIGLFKAVRDFDSTKEASFKTFATLCIVRQMYTAIDAAKCKKHIPLNAALSLDDDSQNSDVNSYMQDLLTDEVNSNPEQLLIDNENVMRLEQSIYNALSPMEIEVFDLRLTGLTYVEIAKILNKSDKSIDNALGRIKSKVKDIINNDKY